MPGKHATVPADQIERSIYLIRGERILLDSDLAQLYGVETGILNRAVRRNSDRFPEDFMFQLTADEVEDLRCQIGTSKKGRGGRRYLPYAFTEQGVAMLSSVLNSPRAIQMNVAIMRTFVRLRRELSTHKELAAKLNELERKIEKHDESIETIFEAIRQLMTPPEKPRKKIGFEIKEGRSSYNKSSKRKGK
ncbi:MAG: ORF6N domain-containing protein [Thermodesulfobacteriota bacterium]|nr:ORF6N domain-containing protein [Thermodesulfobacteriota bacterium]